MTLPQSVAHYRITSKLGEGGMGAVYRAADTRLGREVAIKVLPDSFANDPDRLTWFTREAHVLASLNHPNIAAVYGVEERAIVMELVEGEELKGPVPLETAFVYAGQIAGALDAAHEKGITHRDLKPANIKVTPQGTVKVLDFGLAKMSEPGPAASTVNSPTLTIHSHQTGTIVGTAAYMSPEQARGQAVDKRADIWAFGVILWELLTGRQMFAGDTVSDILAGVLKNEPDLFAVPAAARGVIAACLEKDPRKRLRDIGDWSRLVPEPAALAGPQGKTSRMPWLAALVATIAAAAVGTGWWFSARSAQEKRFFQLDLQPLSGPAFPSISADGRQIALVADESVYIQNLDSTEVRLLPGAKGALFPFFSPDGEWLAFFQGRKLKKIRIRDGTILELAEAPFPRGGSWGEDGFIVAALDAKQGLSRVPAVGGPPEPLTKVASDAAAVHSGPQIIPESGGVLFASRSSQNDQEMRGIDRRGGSAKTVVKAPWARYAGGRRLLYLQNGSIFSVHFDPVTLSTSGTPVLLMRDAVRDNALLTWAFDASREGTVVVRPAPPSLNRRFQWIPMAAAVEALPLKNGDYSSFRVSHDGMQIVFAGGYGPTSSIYVHSLSRDTTTLLASTGGANDPIWTPDGRYVVYREGRQLKWTRADGSDEPAQPDWPDPSGTPQFFTPDGKQLGFSRQSALWIAHFTDENGKMRLGAPVRILSGSDGASLSSDGRWLAYQTENDEVYVVPFRPDGSAGAGKWKVSGDSGVWPRWSPAGRRLFYRNAERQIMAVDYSEHGGVFVPGKAHLWNTARVAGLGRFATFDTDRTGNRILGLVDADPGSPVTRLTLLLNVLDEVRRREAGN